MKEIRAVNREAVNWEDRERSITLTNGQWRLLHTYLLLSQDYREGEVRKWRDLSEITARNGIAARNAEFWKMTVDNVDIVKKVIDEIYMERREGGEGYADDM